MVSTIEDLPVLIMAFQRLDNLDLIVNRCRAAGIRKIYISVDGPSPEDFGQIENHQRIVKYVSTLSEDSNLSIFAKVSEVNLGCSASVLGALDWFFSQVDFGIVLEDDCIPEISFFTFVLRGLEYLSQDSNCMIVSGSQFWASTKISSGCFLSKYPLIWGWATTKSNWKKLSDSMEAEIHRLNFRYPCLANSEDVFWNAGLRRSVLGYLDAWDAILAYVFYANNYMALLPHASLIQNIGNDQFAIHKMSRNRQIRVQTGVFNDVYIAPLNVEEMNNWMRKHIYGINPMRLVTTRSTYLRDILGLSRRICPPLKYRWRNTNN